MTRKSATQVELERRVRELEKELELFKRKYKRSLKQLSKYADQDLTIVATLEAENDSNFSDISLQKIPSPKESEDSYFTVDLPDGSTKRIKRRATQD